MLFEDDIESWKRTRNNINQANKVSTYWAKNDFIWALFLTIFFFWVPFVFAFYVLYEKYHKYNDCRIQERTMKKYLEDERGHLAVSAKMPDKSEAVKAMSKKDIARYCSHEKHEHEFILSYDIDGIDKSKIYFYQCMHCGTKKDEYVVDPRYVVGASYTNTEGKRYHNDTEREKINNLKRIW